MSGEAAAALAMMAVAVTVMALALAGIAAGALWVVHKRPPSSTEDGLRVADSLMHAYAAGRDAKSPDEVAEALAGHVAEMKVDEMAAAHSRVMQRRIDAERARRDESDVSLSHFGMTPMDEEVPIDAFAGKGN